jgi:superfamily I DNA/RNA helicase
VFIVGAEEELIPHKKSVDTSSGVEEERRLFYVGITRAMKELFITYTEKRRKYGKEKPSVPSRFIKEIPEDVLIEIDRFVHMEPEEEKAYVKSMYENFMARFEE